MSQEAKHEMKFPGNADSPWHATNAYVEKLRADRTSLLEAAKLLADEGICPKNWLILRAAIAKAEAKPAEEVG